MRRGSLFQGNFSSKLTPDVIEDLFPGVFVPLQFVSAAGSSLVQLSILTILFGLEAEFPYRLPIHRKRSCLRQLAVIS